MARKKVKRSGPPPEQSKYYGPSYNPRADDRARPVEAYDGLPTPPRGTGVYKRGKARTVLRDPASYDRRNKRPQRS